LRVLLQSRSNCMNSMAGDSVQITKTREYLIRMGVKVDLDSSASIFLGNYDLIHLFNIMPVEETYLQFKNAQRQGKKIVFSPIFWDPEEFLQESGQKENFGTWWSRTMPLREELLEGVELMLPNSRLELEALKRTFHQVPPAVIVPNAADQKFALARPERFVRKYQWEDFLLCVGRISRRKNQLYLIKAAKRLKLPLVIIGPLNDCLYYRECRREAMGQKVLFIDALDSTDLASAYAAARVHALVSWYDTPGLVSLEAALAGCTIVSTDRGSAREYFGELVYYCNPGDLESIAGALREAWKAKKDGRLKRRVLENYTWEKTAEATVEGYRKVLG
jgi:glycosyltransferase involved in cell wall biosynthesis